MYGREMRLPLLLGIFLGLWATASSTLFDSVTQIPNKAEEDVFLEAVTDRFLAEHISVSSVRSEQLQENRTTQRSNQTSSGTDESRNRSLQEDASASGDGKGPLFQPNTTAVGDKKAKKAPADGNTKSGGHIGPGYEYDEENFQKERFFDFPVIQESESSESPEQHKGHVTPDWIIILGFLVGVAALVMLCAAIATRDKWNGPNQASRLQTQVGSTQQQKEAETETFLRKDRPREKGQAEEYTVIQLDELPRKYSQ